MDQARFEELMKKRRNARMGSTASDDQQTDDMGLLEETARGLGRGAIGIVSAPFELYDAASKIIDKTGSTVASKVTGVDPEIAEELRADRQEAREDSIFTPEHYAKKAVTMADKMRESSTLKGSDSLSKNWKEGIKDANWWLGHASESAAYSGALAKVAHTAIKTQGKKQLAVLANKQASKEAKKAARKEISKIGSGAVMKKSMALGAAMSHGEYRRWEKKNPDDATVIGDMISMVGGAAAGSIEGLTIGSHLLGPFVKKFGIDAGSKAAGVFYKELAKSVPKGALKEGTTEYVQTVIENTGAILGYDDEREILDGVVEAMIIGGGVGGGFGVFEAKSAASGKDPVQASVLKVKKAQKNISTLQERVKSSQEILATADPMSKEYQNAEKVLAKSTGELEVQEGILDAVTEDLKASGVIPKDEPNTVPTDEEAFGTTVDPSLTIEEIAEKVDSGEINKKMWEETPKGQYEEEHIALIDQHLQDYENEIIIEKMAAGEDVPDTTTVEEGNLDGTGNTQVFTKLPENYTNEEAVSALNEDLKVMFPADTPTATLSPNTKENEVMNELSSIFGVNVVRVNIQDRRGTAFNGIVSPENKDVIYINESSKRPEMWIFGHEFGHKLEQNNPEAYKILLNTAMQEMNKKELADYMKELDARMGNEPGTTTPQQAAAEMLSDFVGDRFNDKKFWNKLNKENPTKFKEIIDSVRQFISDIMAKFGGIGPKADNFYKDLVRLDNTLVEVINEHVGYTGAIDRITSSDIETGKTVDLNKDNKHWTNIEVGANSSIVLREDKDKIQIKRLSRPGSRRGTTLNTIKTDLDKSVPTAVLNELKAYATENNKIIEAESGGRNEYLTKHGFTGRDRMQWDPARPDGAPVSEDKPLDIESGLDPASYQATKERLEKDIADLDAEIPSKSAVDARVLEGEKVKIQAEIKELDKKRGIAVKMAKRDMQEAKTEILATEKQLLNEQETVRISTDPEAISFANEQIKKFTTDIDEYNQIIAESEAIIGETDANKGKRKVSSKEQQGNKDTGDTLDTTEGKETDSSNRDQQGEEGEKVTARNEQEAITEINRLKAKIATEKYSVQFVKDKEILAASKEKVDGYKEEITVYEQIIANNEYITDKEETVAPKTAIPKLADKITEAKKEKEYKDLGVKGIFKKITDDLAKEGKQGDDLAFAEKIIESGIDTTTSDAEAAYQEAFRNHMMSEPDTPSKSDKKKLTKEEKKKNAQKAERRKRDREAAKKKLELNLLTKMIADRKRVTAGNNLKNENKERLAREKEEANYFKAKHKEEVETAMQDWDEANAFEDDTDSVKILKFSVDPSESVNPEGPNPEINKRLEAASNYPKRSRVRKFKDHITMLGKVFTRPLAELEPGKHGFLKDKIRLAKVVDKYGAKQAFAGIYNTVSKLSVDEMTVFTRNIVLADMLNDLTPGKNGQAILENGNLPFGFKTADEVREYLRHYRAEAKKSPRIMYALAQRRKMMLELQDRLINDGFISKELRGNDAYFHHQALERIDKGDEYLLNIQRRAGDKPLSWAVDRSGADIDAYSTDYVISEFGVMSTAIATLELHKIKNEIRAKYDIRPELEQRAGSARIEIPKGFQEWKPSQFQGWGATPNYPDALASKVLEAAKIDPKIKEQMQIASGGTESWIIPDKIHSALSRSREINREAFPFVALGKTTLAWKQWMLLNPLRVVKYNINNMSGDVDIALAYDWKILTYGKQAMKDLAGDIKSTGTKLPLNLHRFGTDLTAEQKAELETAHRLDVIGAGFVMHEVTDVSDEFERLMKGPQGNAGVKAISNWWQGSKDLTNYRENILRLASYRYFKDRLNAGDKGVYGASNPAEIDAITNIDEKAAKLSRELIGDYGRLTEGGEWMRRYMVPFYSWMEINAPRYVRMMKNLKHEGEDKKGVTGAALSTTWKTSVLGAKFLAFTGMVSAWNALLFGDEEDELTGHQKKKMHLILGRRADGSVRYLPLEGAFRDALSWFGGENIHYDITEMMEGNMTVPEKLKEAGWAAPSKLALASRPFARLAAETASGVSFFPDITDPRPIRDKMDHVAKSMSMELFYRWASGKPTRGVANEFSNKLTWNVSKGEASYYAMRKKVNIFNKRKGYQHKPSKTSSKSNALYYYKQALRFADLAAAEKYLKRYYDLGGTLAGTKSSYKLSMPTGGLRKRDKNEFYRTLSHQDKMKLNEASKWYKYTYSNFGKKP